MIESMIVVSIIGLMTAAIAPTMSEMMVDGRQSDAANDLIGLARRVRYAARETGAAHRMDFTRATNDDLGGIVVQVAMTGSCLRAGAWTPALGRIRMDKYSTPLSTQLVLRAHPTNSFADDSVETFSTCFQPSGDTYQMLEGETEWKRQDASVSFSIRREIGGSMVANTDPVYRREILFPPGGMARAR